MASQPSQMNGSEWKTQDWSQNKIEIYVLKDHGNHCIPFQSLRRKYNTFLEDDLCSMIIVHLISIVFSSGPNGT
jgi:hypothetical protein